MKAAAGANVFDEGLEQAKDMKKVNSKSIYLDGYIHVNVYIYIYIHIYI